jgi:hypothetical protein
MKKKKNLERTRNTQEHWEEERQQNPNEIFHPRREERKGCHGFHMQQDAAAVAADDDDDDDDLETSMMSLDHVRMVSYKSHHKTPLV